MNAFERVRELNDLFLRSTFKVNYESFSNFLANHFDIIDYSERSFSRDLKDLKIRLKERYPTLEDSYGELVRYRRAGNCYEYIRQDISAFPTFSEKELNQIASIIDFNKHLFTGGQGAGIVNKLRAISLENHLSKFHQLLPWPAIQLIKDGDRQGSEKLNQLIEYIYSSQIIEITHRGLSLDSKIKKKLGLPLLIKEYNNGWYTGWYLLFYPIESLDLMVKIDLQGCLLYALDRIEHLRVVPNTTKIRIPENFNPANYFKNIIGIYKNTFHQGVNPIERIVIRVTKESWIVPYILKYPLHDSQRLVEDGKDDLRFELFLELNQELITYLFRYSKEIHVEEPIRLVHNLQEMLK
jgi:hypothetical protein